MRTSIPDLSCVGIGMRLGAHISPLARSYIDHADVVFAGVADELTERWVKRLHPDVRSLQPFYRQGKSRMRTYQEMVEAILAPVREGKRVCGVFYGHPGVFAWAPHKAIEVARREGYRAHMEPGISTEDCLYADLGIDPGRSGCQHYEATQFMLYRRRIDPSAWLILWQVGIAGDQSLVRRATGTAFRQVLVDVLARDYPLDHEITIYRAATLAVARPRVDRLALGDLPSATLDTSDTLAIPPAAVMQVDVQVRERLEQLDRAGGSQSEAG